MIVVLADLPDSPPDLAPTLVGVGAALGEVVCLLGGEPDAARVDALRAAGAGRVAWADLDGSTGAAATALAALAGAEDLVLLPATRAGTEVAARLALQQGRALSTGAESVVADPQHPGSVLVTSWAFTSTWTVTTRAPLASVVTVAATAAAPAGDPGADPAPPLPVAVLDVDLTPDPRDPVVVAVAPKPAGRGPRLTDAAVVVSGGRGTDGDFTRLEELAALVGGAVGSSRVAVDLGWAGAERQVGQTGTSVAPQVYIAAGISGAIQHLAGMSLARSVVAINTDPDAPIFRACDLGIVGDLHTVLAETVDLLRQTRPTSAA